MEQKADYSELRKVYFNACEEDVPSHSVASNLELKSEALQESISSRLSEIMSSALEANESLQMRRAPGRKELATRSQEMMRLLQEKYGVTTYSKITQMIKNEDFSEWEQLEQELLSVPIEPLEDELPTKERVSLIMSDNEVEEYTDLEEIIDTDLDYLDALVQHDYGRLKRLQTEGECISSIFSDIIENEQTSNSNYQDDIFNKNIELIFNSEVDLDDCAWSELQQSTIADEKNEEEQVDKSVSTTLEALYLNDQDAVVDALNEERKLSLPKRSDRVHYLLIYFLSAGMILLLIIACLMLF